MNHTRNVYVAVHVVDLILVGSCSQLGDVVNEMKQCFSMKVSSPLTASAAETYVGARCLCENGAIWEMLRARCLESMLGEQGIKSATSAAALAVARIHEEDGDEDKHAADEEPKALRREVIK